MQQTMLRITAILLLCLSVFTAAHAGDVCMVADIRSASVIETADSYLSMYIPAQPGQDVAISVYNGDALVWQQSTPDVAEPYQTEDIYLKYRESDPCYHIAVCLDDEEIDFDVIRKIGRLKKNAACTAGYPLSALSGADGWQCASIVSTADGVSVFPIITGRGDEIGRAAVTVSSGRLSVALTVYDASTTVDSGDFRLALSADEAARLSRKNFGGITAGLDASVDVSAAPYAALWLRLKVSYNPECSVPSDYDNSLQRSLWREMQSSR